MDHHQAGFDEGQVRLLLGCTHDGLRFLVVTLLEDGFTLGRAACGHLHGDGAGAGGF
jgi:hypothetical protein